DGDTGTPGVGILRSMDGGASWTLLDSTANSDSPNVGQGNLTPINDALHGVNANDPGRDHAFVGLTSYKLVVDPTHWGGGSADDVIVYAAFGGGIGGANINAGLWRSLDSGLHWQLMTDSTGLNPAAGGHDATDIILVPATVSSSTGNIQTVDVAYRGVGVYSS